MEAEDDRTGIMTGARVGVGRRRRWGGRVSRGRVNLFRSHPLRTIALCYWTHSWKEEYTLMRIDGGMRGEGMIALRVEYSLY
jgi:hypothetical protein